MISVMVGVVAGAGLVGSIYSGVWLQNGNSKHISGDKQLNQNIKGWYIRKNSQRDHHTYLTHLKFDKNKTEETFTQLHIWKY